MEFYGVLAGVAMRAPGNNGAAGIDDPAALIPQGAKAQLLFRGEGQGRSAV